MTQWIIQSLATATKFVGLGQLKNTTLPIDTRVLRCDGKILAIPGVSGSQDSSLSNTSSNIILEVASFNPQEVARNSFRLGYRSEASKIFAESPSIDLTKSLVVRMSELLGSDYNWNMITQYKSPDSVQNLNPANWIKVDLGYLSNKLDNQGLTHWQPIIESKLQFLGKYDSTTQVLTFNRFYQAIRSQDNLLCEIIRMVGFDSLKPQNLELAANPSYNKQYDNLNILRNCVTRFGFDEVITRPFVSKKSMVSSENSIQLLNPYSDLEPYIRDNLAICLLNTYQKNLVRGEKQPRIFEINQTYRLLDNQPKNTLELSLVWDGTNPYIGTSIVQALGRLCGGKDPSQPYDCQPLQRGTLGIGYQYDFGNCNIDLVQVNNKLKKEFDIPLSRSIWVITMSVSDIEHWSLKNYRVYKDMSDYPVLSRDYSLVIPRSLEYRTLINQIAGLHQGKQVSVIANERFGLDESHDKLNITIRITDYTSTPTKLDLDPIEELLKDYIK